MKKIISYMLLNLSLMLALSAWGETSKDLADLLNPITTMEADFKQTIFDNRGAAIQHSRGRMSLSRPGKFRWDVKKPIPQLIIANDSRLWIYDADLEQVTIRSLSKARGETPALLLSHVNDALEKDFTVKQLENNKANWNWFELIPKQKDSMFESIKMGFFNRQLKEMRLQDHLDHATLIQFSNIIVNQPLAPSLFTFKASAKVDVIDETKKRAP